jgi:RibD C-terminal domain
MTKVIFDISVSLDGFMIAANRQPEEPWVMVGSACTSGRWPGGASVGQHYLSAGLVDEISIHLVPVLFGTGTRMFENVNSEQIQPETLEMINTPEGDTSAVPRCEMSLLHSCC